MTTYWKSQPKKFCELCKCWLSDNPTSIAIHEKGLGHKDNLKRKILQINEDQKKKDKEARKHDKMMKEIEEAATKSYRKDLITQDGLTEEEISSLCGPINKQPSEELKSSLSKKTVKKSKKDKNKSSKVKNINNNISNSHSAPYIGKWKTVTKDNSTHLKENEQIIHTQPFIDLQLPETQVKQKKLFYQVVEQNIKNPEFSNIEIASDLFTERTTEILHVVPELNFSEKPIDKKHQLEKADENTNSTLFLNKRKRVYNARCKISQDE